MMTYGKLRDFAQAGLAAQGWVLAPTIPPQPIMPTFIPGPVDPNATDVSPDALVIIVFGPGPGRSTEGAFDRQTFQIRSVGPQGAYDDAEAQAWALDSTFVQVGSTTYIGGIQVGWIQPLGGGPAVVENDDGDRYHFVSSYVIESASIAVAV